MQRGEGARLLNSLPAPGDVGSYILSRFGKFGLLQSRGKIQNFSSNCHPDPVSYLVLNGGKSEPLQIESGKLDITFQPKACRPTGCLQKDIEPGITADLADVHE